MERNRKMGGYKVMIELEEGVMEIDFFATKEEAEKFQEVTIETFCDYKQCWIEKSEGI